VPQRSRSDDEPFVGSIWPETPEVEADGLRYRNDLVPWDRIRRLECGVFHSPLLVLADGTRRSLGLETRPEMLSSILERASWAVEELPVPIRLRPFFLARTARFAAIVAGVAAVVVTVTAIGWGAGHGWLGSSAVLGLWLGGGGLLLWKTTTDNPIGALSFCFDEAGIRLGRIGGDWQVPRSEVRVALAPYGRGLVLRIWNGRREHHDLFFGGWPVLSLFATLRRHGVPGPGRDEECRANVRSELPAGLLIVWLMLTGPIAPLVLGPFLSALEQAWRSGP
jgi:hypothetical protein